MQSSSELITSMKEIKKLESLNKTLNVHREENMQLKEQMHRLQKEMESKDLYIKELTSKVTIDSTQKNIKESELRKYVKELTKELSKAKKEQQEIREFVKNAKLKEAKTELKACLEECERLKEMIRVVKEEKEYVQVKTTQRLLLENKKLLNTIEAQEYELKQLYKRSSSKKNRTKTSPQVKRKLEREFKGVKATVNKLLSNIHYS